MERTPQELLPIIPPSVARLLVAVSGPSRRPKRAAAALRSSCTTPGCTRARRRSGSISRIPFMYLEQSSTTARQNHADGQDLVDAGVRAVEDAGEVVEAHRAAHGRAQLGGQGFGRRRHALHEIVDCIPSSTPFAT